VSLKKLRVSINDFDVKGIIRQGHFGKIQVARERGTDNVYALKILHKAVVLSQQNVSSYDEERNIMARANSQWIAQLHYTFQDQHNLYLAMDFHPGGDLLSLLNKHDSQLDEASVRFYLAEIVAAVHSLHSLGYVHRDTKPKNVKTPSLSCSYCNYLVQGTDILILIKFIIQKICTWKLKHINQTTKRLHSTQDEPKIKD